MTKRTIAASGTSNPQPPAPQSVLQYPKPITNLQQAKDIFCYVIRHYGNDGLAVLIDRKADLSIRFGDWNGNVLDMSSKSQSVDLANQFLTSGLRLFASVMKSIDLKNAQFFFANVGNNLVLTDIQLSLNKLCGPGMVRDIFGNVFSTQEIIKTEVIDDRAISAMTYGTGAYAGDLMIKPSKFRMYHDPKDNTYTPLYVEIKR